MKRGKKVDKNNEKIMKENNRKQNSVDTKKDAAVTAPFEEETIKQKVNIAAFSVKDEGGEYFGEMTVKFIFTNRNRTPKDYDDFYKKINQCCSVLS